MSSDTTLRAYVTLDANFDLENALLTYLENTDKRFQGKMIRSLVRAGYKNHQRTSSEPARAHDEGGQTHEGVAQ